MNKRDNILPAQLKNISDFVLHQLLGFPQKLLVRQVQAAALALLELLKLGKAHVRQNGTFDRIMLVPGRREEETDGAE